VQLMATSARWKKLWPAFTMAADGIHCVGAIRNQLAHRTRRHYPAAGDVGTAVRRSARGSCCAGVRRR
jgi:hypothetical protein